MIDLRSTAPGTRVVVRYRLDDGRATDALGPLESATATQCTISTARGLATIALADVIAAKEVPPAPTRRSRTAG